MSWRFVARRVAVALATLAAIVVFNFFLFRALGDPSKDLIRGRLPLEVREAIIHERGYDQSTLSSSGTTSATSPTATSAPRTRHEKPVLDEVMSAIPNTLLLLGLSTILSIWIGTRLGIMAAWRRGKTRTR